MPKLGPACLCLVLLLPALHAAPAGEGVPTYHGKTLKQWVELSRDDDPKVRLRAVVHLGLGPAAPPRHSLQGLLRGHQ